MLKSNIIWPEHRRYKSRTEWEPIGFFSDCLCNATYFDLMLGFFSSSAISVLANGFAVFLYNGGKMRLIVNDILTDEVYLLTTEISRIREDTWSVRTRRSYNLRSHAGRTDLPA